MMKKSYFLLAVFTYMSWTAGISQDPCLDRKWVTPYTTSWIANDGGTQSKHAQHWIEYLSVRPDGTVATSCGWDEGGSNVIIYKNGQVISVPEGSGTGGWGRMSMAQAVMDGQYVYHLQSQNGCDGATMANNINKLPQYPKCGDEFTWKTVRRYKISDGKSANFSNGYGYSADMLLVHAGLNDLTGIAIKGNELFVSDASGDSVKVYDKTTMSTVPLRKFKFADGVGQLSPDNQGGMWMLQLSSNKLVRFSTLTGEIQAQEIQFTAPMVASAFFVDTLGNRILVADNGIEQNIKIYTDIYSTPVENSTFGETNGIFSGVQGQYAPGKLFDIRGVGADSAGNIYVANCAPNGGSILQAYAPDGSLLWDRKGMVFTATACADPNVLEDVYTFNNKMKLDYSRTTPGSEWSFDAYTLNRFKYPDDPRLHGGFMTSAWIKYIDGKKFLFTTDMYASQLAGYRFDPTTDGEVAIPCLFMNIGGWDVNNTYPTKLGSDKDFIWMDLNGDGTVQTDEFTFKTGFDNPYSMAIWIDSQGNLWKGIREKGIRFIPLKEVNAQGVPVYDFADSKLLDIANGATGINGVKRLFYDFASDELYIAGFSDEKPDRKSTGEGVDSWWCMGSTVCMYKNVYATLQADPSTNFKNVLPAWRIFVPFAPEGDVVGDAASDAKSFTVEGEFMFIATAQKGRINVFKRVNGEYIGQIAPGTAINGESGWTDIDYAINVNKTPDEYRIFIEENAFAKVVLYRVTSFETIDTYFPDLIISDFKLMNSQNQEVTHPEKGEKLHFSMEVKNTGPGISAPGSKFGDGHSVLISIKIIDPATNKNLGSFGSDTCTSSILPGQSIHLVNYSTTKAFEWVVPKGEFTITATVNYSNRIKECTNTNNTAVINTNSFDSVYISVNPEDASVNVNGSVEFVAEALGNAPISYTWYINDIEQTIINSPVLSLTNVKSAFNQAKIKVVACNDLGCVTSNDALLTVNDPFGPSRPGFLLRQVWYNHSGTTLADLTSIPGYPENSDSVTFIDKFEVFSNIADNYGTRVSGWVIAPQTGDYVFYIASDDNGAVWLSSDSLQENLGAGPIAWVPEWTDPNIFTKFPEQTSLPIPLEEGKSYFVEALFKEESGGDNLSVAWKLPDGTTEKPIPSSRISYNTGNPVISVKDADVSSKLLVYPSPANDHFFVKASGFSGWVNVTVMDVSGRILKTEKRNTSENSTLKVNVMDLRSGIYILSVSNMERKCLSKFVIQD